MKAKRRLFVHLGLTALLLSPAPPSLRAEDADRDTLLRDGHYQEAYEATLRREGSDAEKLRQAALALLGVSMESQDSYVRWFALRAAQPLTEAQLAPHARAALDIGDRYDHSLALDVLLNTDPAGSREQFLAALDSPHRSIRLRSLKGLATLREPGLAERFTAVLKSDPDPDLRTFAVRALEQTGSPQIPAGLFGALEDGVPAVQEEAVRALVRAKSPGLTPILRRRLADVPREDRVAAIRLASFSDDPTLLPDLGPFLADPDPDVRAYAAAAILAIGGRSEAGR